NEGAVTARAGRAFHRHRRLFRLGGFGLSPAEGARPDRQPGLYRDQSRRRVQRQDHRVQPALAERLYLSQGDRLGLVLPVQRARRLGWKLCTTMKAEDVTATLDLALRASGLHEAKLTQRPRLLSDNGSSYVAGDLAKWLKPHKIKHVRGAPYHPMTQGTGPICVAGSRPSPIMISFTFSPNTRFSTPGGNPASANA